MSLSQFMKSAFIKDIASPVAGRLLRSGARLLVAVLLVLPSAYSPVFSQEKHAGVSIILSNDAEPFLQALSGIKAIFAEKEIVGAQSHNLKNETPAGIASAVSAENPQIILALGTPALSLAKEKFPNVPTVFCMTLGAKDASSPQLTGVALDIPLMEKLRHVKEIAPDAKRIGIIYSSGYPITSQDADRLQETLGLKLVTRKISSEKDVPTALEDIQWQIDLLLMVPDSTIYSSHSVLYLLQQTTQNLLPVVGLSSSYTKAGALFSVDCDYADLGRQSGEIAARILGGEKPSDIPIANPRRLTYSINVIVAKRMKIEISNDIIRKAGEVFGQ